MKKLLASLLLTLLLFTKSFARNDLPPVYVITTDSGACYTIPNTQWQGLEDKNGKLTFEQVRTDLVAINFYYSKDSKWLSDKTVHCYWIRYLLKNTMNHSAKICLSTSYGNYHGRSDYYLIDANNKITHKANGFLNSWSELSGFKEFRVVPIELKAGEEIVVYWRVENPHYAFQFNNIRVGFCTTENMMQQMYAASQTNYENAMQDLFIVGVLAFASLFIFFFYIIIREKVYLYFALYLFALSIGRFNVRQRGEMYSIFFKSYPVVYEYLYQAIWFFSVFFLILFIRHLLQTKELFPRWNRFLATVNTVYAATYLIYFLVFAINHYNKTLDLVETCVQVLLSLTIPVTFLISFRYYKNNIVLTYIVLPLQSVWSICWSVNNISTQFNVNIFPILVENWFGFETILLICLVMAFSWILLQRFGDLKKQIVQKELEKEIEKRTLIENQKTALEEQVAERTADLKQSLDHLKSTQAQLIQSEKMASLGELTAGIAHEIQNPLNFVNNFSEVNSELIEELKREKSKVKNERDDQLESELLNDIAENEKKINHHGKRADAIVKGMLQHSQKSSGKKEPTDINALCDEYLRLAYHARLNAIGGQGLRAKDKTFNVTMQTDFDESLSADEAGIGNINIVPQDIGRVLLNLINNAFYAVNEKQKAESLPTGQAGLKLKAESKAYEPTISVSTKRIGSNIEIRVTDNGNGIPQKIVDKIFQPFFTTKPTGQGTGLGLGLSYDIVKAHSGEIKVESKEGEGAEFIIQLPVI